jgi:hypothetical protein
MKKQQARLPASVHYDEWASDSTAAALMLKCKSQSSSMTPNTFFRVELSIIVTS